MSIFIFHPTQKEEKFIEERVKRGYASTKEEVLLRGLEEYKKAEESDN